MWFRFGVLCGLVLVVLGGSLVDADIQCDGIDDLISSGLNLDTFVNTNAFTVMAFLNSTGSTFGDDQCWGNGPFLMDVAEGLAIGRSGTTGTGSACVFFWDTGSRNLVSPLSAGWHHIAVRLSAGTLELFTDGVSRQSLGVGALGDGVADTTLHLCGQSDGHSPDRITQVKLYNVGLSNAEIEGDARSRLRYNTRTKPTAFWPLDECPDGTTAPTTSNAFKDRSGNARHITGVLGANGTGLTCRANGFLSRAWGIQ